MTPSAPPSRSATSKSHAEALQLLHLLVFGTLVAIDGGGEVGPHLLAPYEGNEGADLVNVISGDLHGKWAASAAVLLVGLCGLVAWPLPRNPTPVARLARSAGAQWDGATVTDGTGLVAGRQLSLSAGVAELSLGQGKATVIVEGPARVTVESPTAMSLASGRLAGTVAGGGFRVQTPSTIVTDLGTEFGVSANTDGSTRVEVFKGKVRAEPVNAGGAPAGTMQVLTEGQAATAKPTGVDLDPAGAVPQRFVRAIRSRATSLDVVDLVAGGDGTTRRRGLDIDPTSGQTAAPLPATQGRGGDGTYHPVPNGVRLSRPSASPRRRAR